MTTIRTKTVTTPSVGSSATFGSSVTDHAVVTAATSGGGSPTGTVTCYINLLADRGIGAATGRLYHAVGEAQATCPPGVLCRLAANTYKVIPDPACPQTTMTVYALVTFDENGHIVEAVFSPQPINP